MAAGLTVHPENVPALRTRLNELARAWLKPDQLQPRVRLDAEVTPAAITVERLQELARLQPAGQGNPPVQLLLRGVTLRRPPQRLGREQQHLKFWVTDGAAALETVWWNGAGKAWPAGTFDVAVAPAVNEFNGRTTVQLKLLAWRPHG